MQQRIATVYKHVQDTPASEWAIVHSLGGYPIVDCYIDNAGTIERIMPSAVTFVDVNTCTVTFASSRAGFATVV